MKKQSLLLEFFAPKKKEASSKKKEATTSDVIFVGENKENSPKRTSLNNTKTSPAKKKTQATSPTKLSKSSQKIATPQPQPIIIPSTQTLDAQSFSQEESTIILDDSANSQKSAEIELISEILHVKEDGTSTAIRVEDLEKIEPAAVTTPTMPKRQATLDLFLVPKDTLCGSVYSILTKPADPQLNTHYNQQECQKEHKNAIARFGGSMDGLNAYTHFVYAETTGRHLPKSSEQLFMRKRYHNCKERQQALFLPSTSYAPQSEHTKHFFFPRMIPDLSSDYIASMHFNDSKHLLCTGSAQGVVRIFDYEKFKINTEFECQSSIAAQEMYTTRESRRAEVFRTISSTNLTNSKWLSNDTIACSSATFKHVTLFNLAENREEKIACSSDVFDLEVVDANTMYCGCRNGDLRLIDLRAKNKQTAPAMPASSTDKSVPALKKKRKLKFGTFGGANQTVTTSNAKSEVNSRSNIANVYGTIHSLQLSNCKNIIYAATESGHVVLWDIRNTARVVRTIHINEALSNFDAEMASEITHHKLPITSLAPPPKTSAPNPAVVGAKTNIHKSVQRSAVFYTNAVPLEGAVVMNDESWGADMNTKLKTLSQLSSDRSFDTMAQAIVTNPNDSSHLALMTMDGTMSYLNLLTNEITKVFRIQDPHYSNKWLFRYRKPCFLPSFTSRNSFISVPSHSHAGAYILDWSLPTKELYKQSMDSGRKELRIDTSATFSDLNMLAAKIDTTLPIACCTSDYDSGDIVCGSGGNAITFCSS